MIVTKKHLPRRTFLKGMGATIALPMLDAMSPALSALSATTRSAAQSPLRLAFTYVPNGITMADWTPQGSGTAFELTRVMKPMAPFRGDMSVLSGLAHRNGMALGDGPGDHARAAASYLTGVHPRKTAGADIQNGISVDQIAAQHIGSQTRFASLELGCDDSRTVGNCDSGYSCAYTNSLAWRGPSTPMPPETNPRLVFERLFGDIDTSLSPEARARRMRYRRSILDLVGERTNELSSTLGPADKRKLDEYLSSIREIEQRIERSEKDMTGLTPNIDKPTGIPVLYADYVNLMFDLQLIALQTDMTRVVTMMMGREGSMRTYPEIGVPDPHHPLTHHRGNTEWIERVTKVNELHMRAVRRLHRQGEGHARRRRLAAGSLGHRLWQRPQRRQPPHPRRPAGPARRPWRQLQAGPAHRLPAGHADDESLPHAARPDRRAARESSATARG